MCRECQHNIVHKFMNWRLYRPDASVSSYRHWCLLQHKIYSKSCHWFRFRGVLFECNGYRPYSKCCSRLALDCAESTSVSGIPNVERPVLSWVAVTGSAIVPGTISSGAFDDGAGVTCTIQGRCAQDMWRGRVQPVEARFGVYSQSDVFMSFGY